SVLIVPAYNPTPGFSLKDGDFRGLSDRELSGHQHRNIDSLTPEIDQKVGKTAARLISPSARGGT
ncbi:MAG: hypothetical protein QOH78_272, partial [Verrucomicrobiota bacterium]